MKNLLLLPFFIAYCNSLFPQSTTKNYAKPLYDTSAFNNWPGVHSAIISNDGNYVLYNITCGMYGQAVLSDTLVLHSIKTNWELKVPDILPESPQAITEKSDNAIFLKKNDSLGIMMLGTAAVEYVPHVATFQLFKQGSSDMLLYQLNTFDKKLVIRDLFTNKEQSFTDLNQYVISENGNTLVLLKDSKNETNTSQSLHWVSLQEGIDKVIWEGARASNLILDSASSQLAFTVERKINDESEKVVYCFKKQIGKTFMLVDNQSVGVGSDWEITGISSFNKAGDKLYCGLKERKRSLRPGAIQLDVWSYRDARLQSDQISSQWTGEYLAVIDINKGNVMHLQDENEEVERPIMEKSDDILLATRNNGDFTEWNWNTSAAPSYYLVSLNKGERKEIQFDSNYSAKLSPGGNYVLGLGWWRDVYSYEISTGITRKITSSLPIPVGDIEYDQPYVLKSRGLQIASWLDNDRAILIYDKFDIWQVDPSSKKAPINLTNGYGRKNNIVFRLTDLYSNGIPLTSEEIIVSAFNQKNKSSGFYRIRINKNTNPELLSIGPYSYGPTTLGKGIFKARDADSYLVLRQSVTKSPNYFWTKDFKNFVPITAVYPEREYKWLKSELISFMTLDNRREQAVLYKPDDFDSTVKYPVIIHYYSRKSQNLHSYPTPGVDNGGELDISWFVSHGYIVLTPDIHYRVGEIGKSVYNSIVGAYQLLSSYPWVDAKHMGIQGHSLGGYETNYLVTHTHMFAAACSSSGMSDFISNYLGLLHEHTNHDWYENRICRIGATLWERPDLFIKNSPIFQMDKVTTPLLTVANKKDYNVYFNQGEELIIALRRLGRKAWMLQYDGMGHGLEGKEYIDYVLRMTQFFDHYLKNAPAPKWMTRGIPAKLKGIDDGLELDYEIKTPGPGLSKK